MIHRASGARLVALVCAAQVLVQWGAYFWPALLPGMMPLWGLTNSEAGWITAAFYGTYLLAVPILVTLTDRIDARWASTMDIGPRIRGGEAIDLLIVSAQAVDELVAEGHLASASRCPMAACWDCTATSPISSSSRRKSRKRAPVPRPRRPCSTTRWAA